MGGEAVSAAENTDLVQIAASDRMNIIVRSDDGNEKKKRQMKQQMKQQK